jgi:multiple sugar transport system ATP-binding protein
MRGELKHLHKELNETFIYVTHDQLEAVSMADRIAVMNLGVLQQFDTPERIYNQPTNVFVAGFIGEPPMNFIPCALERKGNTLVCRHDLFTLPLGEKMRKAVEKAKVSFSGMVVLGVRPEDILLSRTKGGPGYLRGEVFITEPWGSKLVVDVSLGTERIKVKTGKHFDAKTKQSVYLKIDAGRIYLFDTDTTNAIV